MDLRVTFAVVMVATGAARPVGAQTATQVVRFQVNAVNQIAVSGNPMPMVINSATPGSMPTAVVATGTTYAVKTNETNQKISASIDRPMPAGVTLEVSLAAPASAASLGTVALTTGAADVVSGISSVAASALPITYRLSATTAVQMPAAETRTVTFTIVSGS